MNVYRYIFRYWRVIAVLLTVLVHVPEGFVSGQEAAEGSKTPEKTIKGHLRPFGESGKRLKIEVKDTFPESADFFVNYVQRSVPVKVSGAVRNSPAVRQWTDEYLLSLKVPHDSVVHLETKKKENRQQETEEMHFHDFLRLYNRTEHYLVDDVPPYLRPDITVPCGLQCPEVVAQGLIGMMWFSSGGTKSVIHTDAFDNINCLLHGEKSFVLVDPAHHREKIVLKNFGAYSDIDVDSVDLLKYPGVADMEFYHVNMTAGDCLYIPYRWIHQVRSYNRNVAVNLWWNHYSYSNVMDEGKTPCLDKCDPHLTLDQVKLTGVDVFMADFNNLRDVLRDAIYNGLVTQDTLQNIVSEDWPIAEAVSFAKKFFAKLDLNQDGLYTAEDHTQVPVETWKEMVSRMAEITKQSEEELSKEGVVNTENEEPGQLKEEL